MKKPHYFIVSEMQASQVGVMRILYQDIFLVLRGGLLCHLPDVPQGAVPPQLESPAKERWMIGIRMVVSMIKVLG